MDLMRYDDNEKQMLNPCLALINNGISSALKAQAASMANTDNTNKNTRTSGTPVARKGINDHKRKIEDRGNTTTNNNYPKHNNNNHSNNRNNNNYQDNNNKNNHNNDYHQQQHRRQETIRTYPTKTYHGNRPLVHSNALCITQEFCTISGSKLCNRGSLTGTAEAKDQPREATCYQCL
ncbi:hypothetical protein Tco_0110571 [Tanacetum coccineum]